MTPQEQLRKILASPEAYATTLLAALIDQYGMEVTTWHPQTIHMQVAQDLGVELPPANLNAVMAAIAILTTDYFFKSLDRFITLCNILAGDTLTPGQFNPATVAECAWGITEALILYPPDEEEPFCDEIRHYLAAILQEEGFVRPPDVLQIALGADMSGRVSQTFSDEPAMFAAVYEVQEDKTREVTDMIRGNLQQLVQQLRSLPLENGDAQNFISRLPRELAGATGG